MSISKEHEKPSSQEGRQTEKEMDMSTDIETMSQPSESGTSTVKRWAPLMVIATVLGVAWLNGWFDYVSLSSLIMYRETLQAFVSENLIVAVGSYVLLYAALVAISFPGASLLTIAAGFLFGGVIGAILTVVGATTGAVIIFEIAKSSFGKTLERKTGRFVGKLRKGFQDDAFLYLLALRLTPVFPFWVMNIVPALLGMRVAPYALATFLGIIPGTFAYAYIGAGLDSVILAQEEANPGCAAAGTCQIDPGSLVTTEILIAMAGLGMISLLPVVVRKVRSKPLPSQE